MGSSNNDWSGRESERMHAMSRETAGVGFFTASLHEGEGGRLRPEFSADTRRNLRRKLGEFFV